ncbi:lipopeptide [Vibrio astriarenae]|uniref:Lipopeptide n=1 Tax=Vibrio astriarenae TaxID=1481923 RepID=A0A7Z2YCE0_9VIBR|nr:lipoprotein [Vibrio astriarenae]QIA62162.1 lipopeptide [Vibrio astriarenae]
MKKSLVVMFIVSTLAIAGCGQSGALYLPQDDTQSEQTQQQ